MSFTGQLKMSASLYRPTTSSGFEPTTTWALVSAVDCIIDASMQDKQYLDGTGKSIVYNAIMYMDYATVYTTDRIVYSGDKYEIVYIDNPNGLNHHLELYLKRLPGDMSMTIPAV